jgi:hypothetical protein
VQLFSCFSGWQHTPLGANALSGMMSSMSSMITAMMGEGASNMGGTLPNCANKSVRLLLPRSDVARFKRERFVAMMLRTDSWTPMTEPKPLAASDD